MGTINWVLSLHVLTSPLAGNPGDLLSTINYLCFINGEMRHEEVKKCTQSYRVKTNLHCNHRIDSKSRIPQWKVEYLKLQCMLSNLPLKRLFQFGANEQHVRATVSILEEMYSCSIFIYIVKIISKDKAFIGPYYFSSVI